MAICDDRHFPEYMRALAVGGAEIVVVPQAGSVGEWPEGLYEAEMRVAAFQNGYFTALCNRVGEEECLTFGGESFVCAPNGEVIAQGAGRRGHDSLRRLRPAKGRALTRAEAVPEAPEAGALRTVDLGSDGLRRTNDKPQLRQRRT